MQHTGIYDSCHISGFRLQRTLNRGWTTCKLMLPIKLNKFNKSCGGKITQASLDKTWTHSRTRNLSSPEKFVFLSIKHRPKGCSVNAFLVLLRFVNDKLTVRCSFGTIQSKFQLFCWRGCCNLIIIPTRWTGNSDGVHTPRFRALSFTSKNFYSST